MKSARNILILLVLCAFCVVELSAQTKSSAAQTVTFGVRRIAVLGLSASNIVGTTSQSTMKVTVGSGSQVQEAVELKGSTVGLVISSEPSATIAGATSLRLSIANRKSETDNLDAPPKKLMPASRLSVTLTE
jgi:hypothetical protein